MNDFVSVGKKSNFKDAGLTGIEVNGVPVCVARAGDTFYAFDDRCTHAQVMLSRGDLEEREAVCPLHGARFSVETGQALTPPAVKPVRMHEVKLEGDDVFIRLHS